MSAPSAPATVRDGMAWIPGGSFSNYCLRYRPAARPGESVDTSTSHIGFRCILRDCPPL